jgi:putative transposase
MHFVTAALDGRRPVFHTSRLAELFIETLLQLRARGRFKLHAYLVLPDHVHLLMTPLVSPLTATVTQIKTAFANRADELQYPVWEQGFTSHPIPSLAALENLRTYLHQAPVNAGLVTSPELYPYSSAYRQSPAAAADLATTPALQSAS